MDTNTSISYEDLLKTSELLEKKIHQNSVSLLIAENNIDFVKGYVGFLNKKNNISILVDESFSIEFLQKIISLYQPNYIFLPIRLKKKL